MTKPSLIILSERQTVLREDHNELTARVTVVEDAVKSFAKNVGHIKWAIVASAVTLIAGQIGIFEALKLSLKFL